MARSQIAVTDVARTGVAPGAQTTADATNKHYFINDDRRVMLEIISTDAGSQTVQLQPNPDLGVDGLTVSPLTITVAAGATVYAGPFKTGTFKQSVSNDIYVDPSVSTTLKFRCYRLPGS